MEPRPNPTHQLAVIDGTERRRFEMTPDKIQLLKDTMCLGATDNELELALALVERMQLDPFARQIAFIKRWNKDAGREVMTPQVTIDGARLLAERTRKYGGQLGPWWCGSDGIWTDIWLKSEAPAAARVGVIRTDWREPLYAVARFDAYAAKTKEGKLTMMWAKMPDILIAKCAEMLALRRAFPAELSGIYSDDEMAQASNIEPAPPARIVDVRTGEIKQPAHKEVGPGVPLRDAKKALWDIAQAKGLDKGLLDDYAQETCGAAPADMALTGILQLTQNLKHEDKDALLDRMTNRPSIDTSTVETDMFPDVEFGNESPDRFRN